MTESSIHKNDGEKTRAIFPSDFNEISLRLFADSINYDAILLFFTLNRISL